MTQASERLSIYEPEQPGLIFPRPPVFDTVEEERQHRKERLAAACRAFGHFGFSYGAGGHLTVRDPGDPDLYWTNPYGVPFHHVRTSELIKVNHDGIVVEGEYACNRAGFVLHSAIHEHNPDIVASCHAHTLHGAAFSALGRTLDPVTQDSLAFYNDHAVITEEAGAIVVEVDAGKRVGAAFGDNKVIIHQHHGLFAAGRHSIDEAAWWFISFEHAVRAQMLIYSSGIKPEHIPDDAAKHTFKHTGTPFYGWMHFQTVYARMLALYPDLTS